MRLTIVAFALLCLVGCSGSTRVRYESRPHDDPADSNRPELARHHGDLHIPPGHFPPPGQCRIWIPGTPPGKQPRSGSCGELAQHVPPGAWLLSRHADGGRYVEVSVYDEVEPGLVIDILIYTADTGEFVTMKDFD